MAGGYCHDCLCKRNLALSENALNFLVELHFRFDAPAFRDLGDHPAFELSVCHALNALEIRIRQELRIFFAKLGKAGIQNRFELFRINAVGNTEVHRRKGVSLLQIDDARKVAVVYDFDIPVPADDLGGADPDFLHHAGEVADVDDVADLEIPFKDDEETG